MHVSQRKLDIERAYGVDDQELIVTYAVDCEVGDLSNGRDDRPATEFIQQPRQHRETSRILTDVQRFYDNMEVLVRRGQEMFQQFV